MTMRPLRPRRSVLYVPATNAKALAKIATLSCDVVVIDLEDAVAPSQKVEAREAEELAGGILLEAQLAQHHAQLKTLRCDPRRRRCG